MVKIIDTTPEKMFSEINLQDEGFVLMNANDCENFSLKIEEFTKLAYQQKVIFSENPWRSAYKIRQNDGKVSIVLVAEHNARDLNLPMWVNLNQWIFNGRSLGVFFGLLSKFHKSFLDSQKQNNTEKTVD